MLREWAVACAARSFAACLVGWEPPANRPRREGRRVFEAAWTARPATVLKVVATFGDLARVHRPDVAERLDQWTDRTDVATGERGSAGEALANRIVAYVMARTVPAN